MIKKYLIFLISIYSAIGCMEVNKFIDMTQVATAQIIEYDNAGNCLKVKLSKESSDLVAAILQANIQLKVEDTSAWQERTENSVLVKSIKNDGEITVLQLEHKFNHEFASGKTIDILAETSDKEKIDNLLVVKGQYTTTSERSVIYDLVNDTAYAMQDAYGNTGESERTSQLNNMDIDQTEEKAATTESDNEYLTDEDVNEGSAPHTEDSVIEYVLADKDEEQEKKSDIEVEDEILISQITNSEKKNVAEKRIENIKKHTCDHEGCGKSFAQAGNLKVHKRVHTREKPYTCDHEGCGKSFTQAGNLKSHKRVHTGEKPYACDYEGCGKSFSKAGNLKVHKRVHTREKPYTCDYEECGKSFNDIGNLKRHKRVHTGEKPYTCDYEGCGKSFNDIGNLKRHKRVHTHQKPYICDYESCGKSFARAYDLKKHKKIHVKRKADTELENKTELKKRRKK